MVDNIDPVAGLHLVSQIFGIWILEEVKLLLLHFHFCLEQVVASANPEALKKVIVVKLIKKQVETPLSLE